MATKKTSQKQDRERAQEIMNRLDMHYPADATYLDYSNPYELLFATILSAQCTDARVNMVTKVLFATYTHLVDYANAPIPDIEKIIHSTGFYKNKAKSIQGSALMLLSDFSGEVPIDTEDLIKLPGVGRKTANVVRNHIFNLPSVVVDTHVMRITHRLGFTQYPGNPEKIEQEIMKLLPAAQWHGYNIQIIAHGRAICRAQSPKCDICFLTDLCPFYQKQ